MKSVVYNACYGGFGLSDLAIKAYEERTNTKIVSINLKRHDPILVEVVKELGIKADSAFSILKIAEIPENAEYEIDEYDGFEEVVPPRMTWEQACEKR